MRHMDVMKKQPSRWPWVLGAALLIVAGWGITLLLAPPPEEPPVPIGATAEDTLPPATVPASPDADFSTAATRNVTEIAPLGEEDAGETVRVDGEVVATGSDAFWIVAGSQILRVDSRRRPRKGDSLSIQGTLRPDAEGDMTRQIVDEVVSRHPNADRWTVVDQVKLVETEPPVGDTAAEPS